MPRRRTFIKKRKTNIKKLIKTMIAKSTETKTQAGVHNVTMSDVGVNYDMSSIGGGTHQNQRIGNSYTMTSYRLKGGVYGSDTTNLIRIIIYIPKDATHLIPTSTQPFDPVDLDRFTILSDRIITTASNGPNCKLYNKVCLFNRGRRKGLHVQFTDNLASSVVKNRLLVYMCSDSSASSHPSFKGWWRFYFKDA